MMFKGAKPLSQKCQNTNAPTSFYGALHGLQKCQLNDAPLGRAKGKIQKCQCLLTLPNQSQGSSYHRRNAIKDPPPTFYMVPHKVRRNANLSAHQREGPVVVHRNVNMSLPFPTNHRGPQR